MMNKEKATIEVFLFELYAKYLWPFHRLFVKKYITKRCKNCCLSASASPLSSYGICELCTHTAPDVYVTPVAKREQLYNELDTLFHLYEGKGIGEYDALVLLSGGTDSTALTYALIAKYPLLRIMTLTVDNSFLSLPALDDVNDIVKKLNTAHVTIRPNPAMYEEMFSYVFNHLGNNPCAETVDRVDGDMRIDIARNIAARYKIPLVVSSFSKEHIDTYLYFDSYESKAYQSKKREKVGIYPLQEVLSKKNMHIWWDPSLCDQAHIPRMICPYYVWERESEMKVKMKDFDNMGESEINPLLASNTLMPLCSLVDIGHSGYSSWEPEFSRMVREGKTKVYFWKNIFELREYSAKTGHFISPTVREVLTRLGLSSDIFAKRG